jgi:2-aminoethylphosphonate-pyruvate transaminase
MRLLNPGPVTLSARVRAALHREDLCHREPEFAALQREVRERLARVYAEAATQGYEAVLLTGSGTAAVEAMVGSCVPRDGHALVVSNGVYGDRAVEMLRAQGKRATVIASAWTAGMDLARVDAALVDDTSITHVFAVHHETTTGRLNDLDALGALCVKHRRPLLLDAVSSFGGEELRFDAWNLEAAAASANKCLHGVPGIAFVLVRPDTFSARASGATSVYLDLWRHARDQPAGWSPFTQAVQVLYALQESLFELEEQGGWSARRTLYRTRSARVRDALRDLGVDLFLQDGAGAYSSILTSFRQPPALAYEALHDGLKARGFVVYAGQGPFLGAMFRIAVMGALGDHDLAELADALRATLTSET